MEKESKFKKFWNKINGKELLIIFLIYMFSVFIYLFFAALKLPTNIIKMKIDDYIPFIPVFVIGYYFYYVTWFISVWLTSFRNNKVFVRMCKVAFWSIIICGIIYAIYPVEMLRPTITGNDIFSKAVIGIYNADVNSRTCFPSLHAVIGTITYLSAFKDKGGNIWRRALFVFFGFAITLSAVFIKQHYFIDIVSATVLVFMLDLFFELLDNRGGDKHETIQHKES